MRNWPEPAGKRLKFIGCEIVFREVCLLAAHSRNVVDIEFISKGLHDLERNDMLSRLQERVDAVDPEKYRAILLGYARCSDGVAGLRARTIPLIIPRAHDCITFFLGSRQRYQEYFDAHPGTYFRTSGWIEREFVREAGTVMNKLGLDKTYEEYVKEYGQENADFIWQSLGTGQQNYDRFTYIHTGVARELDHEQLVRQDAEERKLNFERLEGDLNLLRRLLDGEWNEPDFLTVLPGYRLASRNDEQILAVEPADPA